MRKPSLTKEITHSFTGLKSRIPTFVNGSQLHQAWKEWALEKGGPITTLVVITDFDNGDKTEDYFTSATKTVEYKDYDGEKWEVELTCKGFIAEGIDIYSTRDNTVYNKKDLVSLIENWMKANKLDYKNVRLESN